MAALEPRLAYILAADVGNTHITLGSVRGEQAYVTRKVPVDDLAGLGEALHELWDAMEKPRRLVAASVNPAALTVLEKVALEALDEPVAVVGRDIPAAIETDLPEPGQIGVDRLCCAAAAYHRLKQPCVVADFGTAVTIDYISNEGIFKGGAILPGVKMQAAALHDQTSQLPQVEPVDPDWIFGRNTQEAIIGGIILGLRGAMRGLIESYAIEMSVWPTVILTGGDAELIGLEEGVVQAIVPELCLLGIALAFYKSLPVDEEESAAE